jgi:hypothetical protein
VGVEPKSIALPHEGQKRAAPGTSLPQAGQLMVGREYITGRLKASTRCSGHSLQSRWADLHSDEAVHLS